MLAVGLCGCAQLPTPVLPNGLPPAWNTALPAAADALAPDLQRWWSAFDDPALNALVERALADSLGLAQARSRLLQARLASGRDNAQFKPAIDFNARPTRDASAVDSYFHVSLEASWELGLFGLRESTRAGAQARLDRAEADAQAAKVSLVAEVVRQALLLRQAQQQLGYLQARAQLDERHSALLARQRQLQIGSLDEQRALAARQAQWQAQTIAARRQVAAAAQGLATLLALTAPDPAWLQGSAATPVQQALAVQQVPADLLRWRPDIRAAEAEVAHAAADLGIAQAALYPRIVIGASFLDSFNLTNNRRIAQSSVPALGPLIDIPLFDWGRRRAQADVQSEALNTALLAYRQTVVEAVGEAETALSALALQHEQVAALAQVCTLAHQQRALQATRSQLGLAASAEQLEAERAEMLAEQDLATARWSVALAFVSLYRSLGGAPWEQAAAARPGQLDALRGATP